MNIALISISELIVGNWYSEDGKIQYNIDPSDENLEGEIITIASRPLEKNAVGQYHLYEKENAAYLKINGNEYSMENVSKDKITLMRQGQTLVLHKELPSNR